MQSVFFCDFSTHYMMGDSYAMVRFTPEQFEVMINLMKEAEEEDFHDGPSSDKMEEVLRALEEENSVHLYGLSLLQYSDMFGKKSPKQVLSILKQGKSVSPDFPSIVRAYSDQLARIASDKIAGNLFVSAIGPALQMDVTQLIFQNQLKNLTSKYFA